MNLEKLLEYDFAKDFVVGKTDEKDFLAKLIDAVKTNDEFRGKTGVLSLETRDLKEVVDTLKREWHRKSRRNFLGLIGKGIVAAATLPSRSDNRPLDYRSARVLYNEILKISKLTPARMPVASPNPYSPTIIIIEDIHGGEKEKTGWKVEFERLELLRKKFGFNFIGLEGWAGYEADRSRGRIILNGEEKLIEELMKNSDYNILGLEDSGLQFKLMELLLLNHYYVFWRRSSYVYEDIKILGLGEEDARVIIGFVVNHTLKLTHTLKIAEMKSYIKTRLQSDITEFLMKYPAFKNSNHITQFLIEIAKQSAEIFMISDHVYGIKILDEKSLLKLYNELISKYPSFKNEAPLVLPEVRKLMQDSREKIAVAKMLEAMKKLGIIVGVIVCGIDHTDGLLKESIRQAGQNINIIILQEFHDDST